MESESASTRARRELEGLDAATRTTVAATQPTQPIWYALVFGLIGPGAVALHGLDSPWRIVIPLLVALAVAAVGLLERSRMGAIRTAARMQGNERSRRIAFAFAVTLSVIAILNIAEASSTWPTAIVSFIWLAALTHFGSRLAFRASS